MVWRDAESYCNETYGTHLATIKSSTDNSNVREAATNAGIRTGQRLWFGYNDIESEGTWVWTDGTKHSNYTNWLDGEPNNIGGAQNCAQLWSADQDAVWDDSYCTNTRYFVCNAYPRTTRGMFNILPFLVLFLNYFLV